MGKENGKEEDDGSVSTISTAQLSLKGQAATQMDEALKKIATNATAPNVIKKDTSSSSIKTSSLDLDHKAGKFHLFTTFHWNGVEVYRSMYSEATIWPQITEENTFMVKLKAPQDHSLFTSLLRINVWLREQDGTKRTGLLIDALGQELVAYTDITGSELTGLFGSGGLRNMWLKVRPCLVLSCFGYTCISISFPAFTFVVLCVYNLLHFTF